MEHSLGLLLEHILGLQEFIEAMALINFLKHGTVLTYEEVLKALVIEIPAPKTADDTLTEHKEDGGEATIQFAIRLTKREFYLGVLDMTGELVRACANVVYTPDFRSYLFKSLAVVRALYQCKIPRVIICLSAFLTPPNV